MAHQVVCMSGLDGAEMRDVAQGVAAKLKFDLVDEDIVLQAAAAADLDPGVVADAERRRSFIERAIGGFGAGADASAVALAGAGYTAGMGIGEDIRGLLVQAIEETADRGKVVIAAHAASHALGDRSDVVRVLVTASPETRRARVAAARGLDEKEAARAVERSDAARADYLKRFYDTRRELPTQYDLVVNTDRLTPDEAVKLVVLATKS